MGYLPCWSIVPSHYRARADEGSAAYYSWGPLLFTDQVVGCAILHPLGGLTRPCRLIRKANHPTLPERECGASSRPRPVAWAFFCASSRPLCCGSGARNSMRAA